MMITIKNVRTLAGEIASFTVPSSIDYEIEANKKLFLLPGVIDPHTCFGKMNTENWSLAIESLVSSGITTTIEWPNEVFFHHTKKDLERKIGKTETGLADLQVPLNHLHYLLYTGENIEEVDQLGNEKELIKGIAIQLKCEKNEALDDKWDNLFRLAAQQDIPIIINGDNENTLNGPLSKEVGGSFLEKAISFTEKWSSRLYVLNVSTPEEINLIQRARKKCLLVYAETTPQHLFSGNHENSLWEALNDDVIETIGSGYNLAKTNDQRVLFNGVNLSFLDPVFFLPLLLNAVDQKKMTIDKLVRLTNSNVQDILEIEKKDDFVLVDLEKEHTIQKITSGQSIEMKLKGWPVYTIVRGQVFNSPYRGFCKTQTL